MKYIIAALYSNYSTIIVDDTDIEQSDSVSITLALSVSETNTDSVLVM